MREIETAPVEIGDSQSFAAWIDSEKRKRAEWAALLKAVRNDLPFRELLPLAAAAGCNSEELSGLKAARAHAVAAEQSGEVGQLKSRQRELKRSEGELAAEVERVNSLPPSDDFLEASTRGRMIECLESRRMSQRSALRSAESAAESLAVARQLGVF